MESQQPNDLQKNDIESFFDHFQDWWAKWGTKVLLLVLLVVACISAKRFMDVRNATLQEQTWADLANASSPESYAQVASDHAGEAVAALANLRAGDLFLAKGIFPDPMASATSQPGGSKSKVDPLDAAKECYQAAISNPEAPKVVKLNAQLGMATIMESKGDLKTAATILEGIKAEAADEFPSIQSQASARLGLLPRLSKPILYGKETPLPTLPTTAPAPVASPATAPSAR